MQTRAGLATMFVDVSRSQLGESTFAGFLETVCKPCMTLVGADAAAVFLNDQEGAVRVCASSSEVAALYDMLGSEAMQELESEIKPGQIATRHLDQLAPSWAGFAAAAADLGFVTIHLVPMQPPAGRFGVLHLLSRHDAQLGEDTMVTTLAIVDVATIGLIRERSLADAQALAAQLQGALKSRIVIEQAKGIVAERHGITVELAFEALRAHARSHNARLAEVSRATIAGETDVTSGSSPRVVPVRDHRPQRPSTSRSL